MTQKIYLEDPYKKEDTAKVVNIETRGNQTKIFLDKTIFYPQGGGQPPDKGRIVGDNGLAKIYQVQTERGEIAHYGNIQGNIKSGDEVRLFIDWNSRYLNMRYQSAGHVLHEAISETVPNLTPIQGEHNPKNAYLVYRGTIDQGKKLDIETATRKIITNNKSITTKQVNLEELQKEAQFVPKNLPQNVNLQIATIDGFKPVPCGATHLKNTGEIKDLKVTYIETKDDLTKIGYSLNPPEIQKDQNLPRQDGLDKLAVSMIKRQPSEMFSQKITVGKESLFRLKNDCIAKIIEVRDQQELQALRIKILGKSGELTLFIKEISKLKAEERPEIGRLANEAKKTIEDAFGDRSKKIGEAKRTFSIDITEPGKIPSIGHLHLVTQAINEIEDIFYGIGFTRRRYQEITSDWYNFEGLNVPKDHPSRDEQETFFLTNGSILATHTSGGWLREMERRKPPIRMVNISKCYRRQADTRHLWMFHQFEGLVIDKNINISHLKGTLDYFGKNFFGKDSKSRIRPHHFRYTEPSFEVDFLCNLCHGKGCKICKDGWLETGGSGMVHPTVLRNGGLNPEIYSGFAFGWGVERTLMERPGVNFDDIRMFYEPDLRILEQF